MTTIKIWRYKDEKNLSTQKKTEKQGSRLQKENVHDGRQKGIEEKKKQGPQKAERVNKRVIAHAVFET